MNKLALSLNVCADDWTAEIAITASDERSRSTFYSHVFYMELYLFKTISHIQVRTYRFKYNIQKRKVGKSLG